MAVELAWLKWKHDHPLSGSTRDAFESGVKWATDGACEALAERDRDLAAAREQVGVMRELLVLALKWAEPCNAHCVTIPCTPELIRRILATTAPERSTPP